MKFPFIHGGANDNWSGKRKGFLHSIAQFLRGIFAPDGARPTSLFPTINVEDSRPGARSDASRGNRLPTAYQEMLWELGWSDGRKGQSKKTNLDLIAAKAKIEFVNHILRLRTKISDAEAKSLSLDGRREATRARLEYTRNRNHELRDILARRVNRKDPVLGWIYLGCALMLLLADIPLSLTLVARGFDLKTEKIIDPLAGTTVAIEELFIKPGVVIGYLWEPLALALGIALSGVFVKYFLDLVIFRRDEPENKFPNAKSYLLSRAALRDLVLALAFVLFLVTIFDLGKFRAEVKHRTDIDAAVSRIKAQGRRDGLDLARVDKMASDKAVELQIQFERSWADWAFILLTLMFPILGGISFSAGWSRIERVADGEPYVFRPRYHLSYFWSNRVLNSLERRSDRIGLEAAQANAELSLLSAKYDIERKELNDGDIFEKVWAGVYTHGYERGMLVHETIDNDDPLYSRCDAYLTRILAKEVRSKLSQ